MEQQWADKGEGRKRDGWITSDFLDKNNEDESTSMRIRVTPSFCHRLRQFTQIAPKNSKHFLPDGCKTLLHLTNTSWQQHLDQYWFPFLLYLEKHGSHAKRRHCNKVRLPLFITALLKCKGSKEESLGMKLILKTKWPQQKSSEHHNDTEKLFSNLFNYRQHLLRVHRFMECWKCWNVESWQGQNNIKSSLCSLFTVPGMNRCFALVVLS